MKSAAIAVGLALIAAPAFAEVVDFEAVPTGFVGGALVQGSVTFSSPSDLFVGPYGTQQLCPTQGFDCSLNLDLAFAGPVKNLSFEISGIDNLSSVLSALVTFSGGGTTVVNFTSFADGNNQLIDFGSLAGITNVSLSNNDGAGYSYDNFSFERGAVPEPATWALMISGFGLAGGALRRRVGVVAA